MVAEIAVEPQSSELAQLLQQQRDAFWRDGVPDARTRQNRIDRLLAAVFENRGEILDALAADFGQRSAYTSTLSDLLGPLTDIEYVRRRVRRWMRPTPVMRSARPLLSTKVVPTPLGVVGIVGAWNFPLTLVVQPAAAALAAGNRVMIKAPEAAGRTAEVFRRAVAERFSPEELVVVTGGPDVGAEFASLPFDHILFTGSPAIGQKVYTAASHNLVPVTLELGGKNPVVVSPRADLAKSARRIARGRLINGGQVCLCPEVVHVPRPQLATFVDHVLAAWREAFPRLQDDSFTSIIDVRNSDRVRGIIADAEAKGALAFRHETGEQIPTDGQIVPPTVLTGVDDTMLAAQEEIFGPVLVVKPYDRVAEVVEDLRDRPSPLVSYWYGPTDADFDAFVAGTHSGGVTVNDFALNPVVNGAPFGGVGTSGSGAYHGKAGFDTFSHRRAVAVSRLPFSMTAALVPPIPERVRRGVETATRMQTTRLRRRLRRAERRG